MAFLCAWFCLFDWFLLLVVVILFCFSFPSLNHDVDLDIDLLSLFGQPLLS